MKTQPARPALPALTGLRFFAALHVVLFHLWRFDAWNTPAWLERLVRAGPVSVTLFFVLSGFVLTYVYMSDGVLSICKRDFFRARFARIYPLHIFGLLWMVPIVVGMWRRGGAESAAWRALVQAGVAQVTLTQAWMPDYALSWNAPAWSLSCEWFFYLVFPWVATALFRLSARHAWVMVGGLWGASLLGSLVVAGLADHAATIEEQNMWVHVFKFHPLLRLSEFLIGIQSARQFLWRAGQPEATSSSTRALWGARVAWGTFICMMLPLALGQIPYAMWHNGYLAPFFAAMVYRLAQGQLRVTAFFSKRLWVVLGEASYALYVLHVPVLYWIAAVGQRRAQTVVLEHPAVALCALCTALGVSWLAHRMIELPARRWLRPTTRSAPS